MKCTIFNTATPQRISLPEPAWSGRREISTGIYLTGIYIGRSRIVVGTNSVWDDGHGACRGQGFHVAGYEDIRTLQEYLDQDDYERCLGILGIETQEL